ncbi:MAG: DUF3300 domain-containing protein [Reyranellaceae bacterium]
MKRRALLAMSVALLALAGMRPIRAQTDKKPFSPQELDQILAPIALYSDALLAQVLMAASYPIEIVEAARWSKANPQVKGEAAVAAVQNQTWDVSVKSLVAFPSALMMLNDHLDWTQKLGDAMVSQQQDVADSIQRLRAKAADAGNLKSGPQQTVTTQGTGSDQTIIIEPANPDVVYVPSYNPSWAYGAWSDPAYPPVYYPPPSGYGYGAPLATGLLWGLAIAGVGAALYGGWNWARGAGYVNVNVNRAVNIDRNFERNRYTNSNRWQHEVDHRRGVAYRDAATRQQFGQNRPGADQRQQFRGQLANPSPGARPGGGPGGGPGVGQGGQRPNIGQGGGQRPNAGQGGNRPNVGQGQGRPGGDRPSAIGGVNRGQSVNRESARGRAQQGKAASHPRPGGGGGGARGGRR